MEWLDSLFHNQTVVQSVLVFCAVSALGLALGRIKIAGISLGITFVFFVGIIAGHFGLAPDKQMLSFAQSFGLILFVYALGLQVGPGFFSSLKEGGIKLSMLAIAVVVVGLVLSVVLHYTMDISMPDMMGILSGAVTNTPALGAAQQTLNYLHIMDPDIPLSEIALGCAVTYPLGVVGVILALALLKSIFPKSIPDEAKYDRKDCKSTFIVSFKVSNKQIVGKCVRDVVALSHKNFVISRIWKKGKVSIPTSSTLFDLDDVVLIMTTESDAKWLELLFGAKEDLDWNEEGIDWNDIDSELVSRQIIITQNKVNGRTLGSLRIRNDYGVNITRVNRAGIDLQPTRDLLLQMGDKVTVVGERASTKNVERLLGNSLARLKEPNLIAIFIGILMGLIIGSIPIKIPGITVPVQLGIAGGPIIIGILMGAFGPRFSIVTYTTQSANLMLRQIGIVLYLAGLGIDSGGQFFETVFRAEGALWILAGFLLTVIPVMIVGTYAVKFMKMDLPHVSGMLCGSMSNPMALTYANTNIGGPHPAVAYATVYPVVMFLRVITAQLMLTLFL